MFEKIHVTEITQTKFSSLIKFSNISILIDITNLIYLTSWLLLLHAKNFFLKFNNFMHDITFLFE